MGTFEIIYTVISVILSVFLFVLVRKIFKLDSRYKSVLIICFLIALLSEIFYSLTIILPYYRTALFFTSLYYVCTDWLTLVILNFAVSFTKKLQRLKKISQILVAIAVVDSISLLINNVTFHSFDLKLIHSKLVISYWAAVFTPLHYIHLGICYVFVMLTTIAFIKKIYGSPRFYKTQYISVLNAYLLVLAANCFSYTLRTPIDFSVLLYPLLASYISFYTVYFFPKKLVSMMLHNFNHTISDALIYFDNDGRCKQRNPLAQKLFKTPEEAEQYRCSWLSIHRTTRMDRTDTFIIDGKTRHFYIEYQNILDKNTSLGSFFKLSDKTDEINQFQKERYEATHDELTGILNRTGFFEKVDEIIQNDPQTIRYMLCSNIRDFKLINEIFGEKKGDSILRKIANLMQSALRSNTYFGRISDDKFAIFIDKSEFNENLFLEHVQRLRKMGESSIYKMHINIGIYETRGTVETAQAMYDKSLIALEGINDNFQQYLAYYDSNLMDKMLAEKNILSEFETALAEHQFKMYLQPQIDSQGNSFGAEALARWNHPKRGFIYPEMFIDVLEKAGLLYKLDSYIWEEASREIKKWNERGIDDVFISVNVSAKDFFYIDIYQKFTTLVEKYGINPKNLKIEITETVIMTDFGKSMELFERLQKYGFQIEIDDFGSGYSSLNMLKDIKADILKIDIEFLKKNENLERSRIILQTIISMARALNMEIMTEGVEERDQVEMLKELGCNIFQGYYFSKPLTVNEFEEKYIRA